MEVSYELGEEDLREVQAQVLGAQREAWRTGPASFITGLLAAGAVGWVLLPRLGPGRALLVEPVPRLAVLVLVLWVAGAAVHALRSRLPAGRAPAPGDRAVRRLTRAALRRSVLGPVRVALTPEALVRTNAADTLRVRWDEVRDVLRSPRMTTVRLRGQARVVVLPARAFADAAASDAFHALLERLAPQAALAARGASAARGPRGTLLSGALGLALLLLLVERGLPWYFDPRPGLAPERVVVYSTGWCPACARLRACLGGQDIPFEERDVERSARAEAEWRALGGEGVPTTVAGGRVALGMRRDELEPALAAAGHRADCWGDAALTR